MKDRSNNPDPAESLGPGDPSSARPLKTAGLLVAVLALGVVDTLTGADTSFSIFYLLPIAAGTWYVSRNVGLALSLASAFTWLVADVLERHPALPILTEGWNATMRLMVFVLIVAILSALQTTLRRNAFLAAIVRSSFDGIVGLDRAGRIVSWNRAAERILQYTATDAVGRTLSDVLGEPAAESLTSCVGRNAPPEGFEYCILRKNGDEAYLSLSGAPVVNPRGRVVGASIILRDITSRKELDQMKQEFISVVSHELRTPLTSIREAISQVLDGLHGEITDTQRDYLGIALSEIDRLRRIIRDLLHASKLETGMVSLDLAETDLVELADSALTSFRPQAEKQGIEIRTQYAAPSILVVVDADKVRQIFSNLLSNAIKFCHQGWVRVSIRDGEMDIECAVADTGIGIAQEDMPKVFGKFQQFGRSGADVHEGTGLGLCITRDLIRLHGGSIRVESRLGQGTTFFFTLPKNVSSLQ